MINRTKSKWLRLYTDGSVIFGWSKWQFNPQNKSTSNANRPVFNDGMVWWSLIWSRCTPLPISICVQNWPYRCVSSSIEIGMCLCANVPEKQFWWYCVYVCVVSIQYYYYYLCIQYIESYLPVCESACFYFLSFTLLILFFFFHNFYTHTHTHSHQLSSVSRTHYKQRVIIHIHMYIYIDMQAIVRAERVAGMNTNEIEVEQNENKKMKRGSHIVAKQ